MTDEQQPRSESPFSTVWKHYAELTTFLSGGLRTYNQGTEEEREEFGSEARVKLAALRDAIRDNYGDPRIVYAILDARNMRPKRAVRLYFPTTDEVKEAILIRTGRGLIPRNPSDVSDWARNPYTVDKVARVLLYALPDDQREDIWASDMPMWEKGGKSEADMYRDMYLAE